MKKRAFEGELLRERREEMGLTLDEAHERTHVSPRLLRALESGNMDDLPEPCYVIGFIKSYCKVLDLAPEPFIDCYEEDVRPAPLSFLRPAEDGSRRNWLNDVAAWAAVCAIIALAWFGYMMAVRPNAVPSDTRVEAGETREILAPPPSIDLE